MTEQEFLITKAALLEIIQDTSQPVRERNHAADNLLALLERWETERWNWGGSPVQTGSEPGSEARCSNE